MAEYVVEVADGVDPARVRAALSERGMRVKARFGARMLVVETRGEGPPDVPGVTVVDEPPEAGGAATSAPSEVPEPGVSGAEMLLAAHRRRRSSEFADKRRNRSRAGASWDDAEPPDPPEERESGGPPEAPRARSGDVGLAAAPAIEAPPRLVNEVAVGLVFVDAPAGSPYASTPEERIDVLADVQYGLEWLAGQQPGAKISWAYDTTTKTVDVTPWTGAPWPGMPDVFYNGLDAALMHDGNGRIYLFKGTDYIRFSSVAAGVDAGYPKKIADGWHGLPAEFQERIDAAVWRLSDGRIYFFRGSQYVRIDPATNAVEAGYPKEISAGWLALPSAFQAGIDAALQRYDNGKIYFFKGDQYVRVDGTTSAVDPGYPVLTSGNWKGMPDAFNAKIDAALWRKSDGKIYFFRKRDYLRFTDIAAGVDDDYPKPMGLSQNAAEALWRDAAMSQLGQPAGMGGVEAYAASLRDEYGTDTAYVAFFTRWPVTWFAYAGFPRVVMHLNNDGWGFDNIDSVFAHETGHIFGAPDEYSSGCSCNRMAGRFLRAANANCENCEGDGVSCLMRGNDYGLCPQTPLHLGWGAFTERVDAAFWRESNGASYVFSGGWYVRYSDINAGIDEGYPKPIAGNWKSLPPEWTAGIDAAVWRGVNGKIYFFKGSQYARINDATSTMDPGYPKPIAGNWPGLPATFTAGIDAAVRREVNGKLYFFKGSQYARIDDATGQMDEGYPRSIAGNWPGVPAPFTGKIDAALMRHDNHKVYFFRDTRYVRIHDATSTMDPGYPSWIDSAWMPFPR